MPGSIPGRIGTTAQCTTAGFACYILYAWHRTTLQVDLALEREDLLDWCFGYETWTPEKEPEHRSLQRLLARHFKPDGAF